MGIAVGVIGLPYNDFCALTPEEFSHIYKAYSDNREAARKDDWERARMIAAYSVSPYAKKGQTAHSLCPLPWDNKKPEPTSETPAVSKEEALKRFEEVLGKTKMPRLVQDGTGRHGQERQHQPEDNRA